MSPVATSSCPPGQFRARSDENRGQGRCLRPGVFPLDARLASGRGTLLFHSVSLFNRERRKRKNRRKELREAPSIDLERKLFDIQLPPRLWSPKGSPFLSEQG
jgi:hypothetical protein